MKTKALNIFILVCGLLASLAGIKSYSALGSVAKNAVESKSPGGGEGSGTSCH